MPVREADRGGEKWARFTPYDGYRLSFSILFNHPAIDRTGQEVSVDFAEHSYVREVARAPVGDWAQGLAFSRDGRTLLVQNMADRTIAVFRVEGDRLRDTGQRLQVNGGPAALRTADGAAPAAAPARAQR